MRYIQRQMDWLAWIDERWSQLSAGKKLWVTVDEHGHPRHHPDFRTNDGWPVGQRCDYTLSLTDGSRIHVQCFESQRGRHRLRVHRDAFDPDRGLASWLLHGLLETPAGPIALLALLGGVVYAASR